MKPPTPNELAAAIRMVCDELQDVANSIETQQDHEIEWQGEWSTHTLAAYGAIYESITH